MTTEAITLTRHKRLLRDTGYKTFTKPNALRRFRYFIEHSDWDEEILAQDAWIDKMCIGVIIVASLYLVIPVLVMMFFE
jgi:hypothetical protein